MSRPRRKLNGIKVILREQALDEEDAFQRAFDALITNMVREEIERLQQPDPPEIAADPPPDF